MQINLRPYQEKAIVDTRKAFLKNKKVILQQSTGAGKTVIAKYMIRNAIEKGKRVAFIVDRLTLLDQTINVFDKDIDFGVIQGDHYLTDYSKDFQICSAQTLSRRSIKDFDFCVYDESHVLHKGVLDMMKDSNRTYFLGLTATPFTRGLGKYWQDLVTGPTTDQLIRDGFLSEYVAYGPGKPDLTGVRISGGDYNKKDIADRTDKAEITGDIVEHWFKLASDRRTVCMAVNVAHAEHIADAFKEKGVKVDVVHCYRKQGENQKAILDFRNGNLQMLCSVDMISRGFDMPEADCLIVARPTKSLNYHLQALGRILRIADGKENAIILDHAGNMERLGFPDDEFDMVLDMGGKKRAMMCPFCAWEGSAELDDKCPECGLAIVVKPPKSSDKLPSPCPECKTLFKGSICPGCGHERKKKANVNVKDQALVELQKGRHKATSSFDKEKLFSKLLAGARAVGFKDGWAANQYRNYFGVWPAKKNDVEPDKAFYNYIKSLENNRRKQMKILWSIAEK